MYSVKYYCSKSDFLKSAEGIIDKIIEKCENPQTWQDKALLKKIERTRIVIVGTVNGVDENLILFVKEHG